jgi:hypothetical protein
MSEKDCQSCKKQKLSVSEKSMIGFSIFVLVTSIYGTMEIVKSIITYFS